LTALDETARPITAAEPAAQGRSLGVRLWTVTAAAVLAVLVAVWITSSIDPLTAVRELVAGAVDGRDRVSETLVRAAPLALVGLGAGVALRGGVVNVGGEGQMAIGAVGAVLATLALGGTPTPLVWLVATAAAVATAALWSAIPAALAAARGVPRSSRPC